VNKAVWETLFENKTIVTVGNVKKKRIGENISVLPCYTVRNRIHKSESSAIRHQAKFGHINTVG
jgi:hypothetical protein